MKYACKTIDGKHVAVVENGDGDVVSVSPPCDSKFHAMKTRDLARNEGEAVPQGWTATDAAPKPERIEVPEAFSAFDHNHDGRPGGSLPRAARSRKPKLVKSE